MSNRARFIHRKKQATSAPPKPSDAYCWSPGVHITIHAPLDLQAVHNLLARYPWTVCTAVEERTKMDNKHTHIMIWAPSIPIGPTEVKWSAKELSIELGTWPYIVPVLTENQAITVTAYQCKQTMPALYASNAHVERKWKRAVYDKTADLHQRSVLDTPHLCESYNRQIRRIRDEWNIILDDE